MCTGLLPAGCWCKQKHNNVLDLLKTLPLTFDLRPFTFKGSQTVLHVFQALAKAVVFAHVSMQGLSMRLRCEVDIFSWMLAYK